MNTDGCDSVITINLTINQPTSGNTSVTSCEYYVSPSGNYTWVSSGIYVDTISNVNGCDSVITVDLTIENNNIITTVTQTNELLVSDQNGASYQWVDCNDNYVAIPGETNQSFTATANGSYAVIITDGVCTDTSSCYQVTTVGINAYNNDDFNIYPNPASNTININCKNNINEVKIINITGNVVFTNKYDNNDILIDIKDLTDGIYFIKITTANKSQIIKLIKQNK